MTVTRRILAFVFISSSFTFAVPLMAALFVSVGHLNEMEVSIALAVVYLCSGLVQPRLGFAMDRGHFRVILSSASVVVAIGLLGLIFGGEVFVSFVLFTLMLLIGIDSMMTFLMRALMGADETSGRGEAMFKWYIAHNLGMCIAAVLAFLFLQKYQTLLFVGDLITTLAVAGLCFTLIPYVKPKQQSVHRPKMLQSLRLAASKSMRIFLADLMTWTLIRSYAIALPLLYKSQGLDPVKWLTVVLVVSTMIIVVFSNQIKRWTQNISERQAMTMAFAFYGAAYVLFPFFLTPVGICMTAALLVIGEIMVIGPAADVYYRCFEDDDMGLAAGARTTIRSSGMVLSPLLALVVFGLFAASKIAFSITFGLLALISLILFWPRLRSVAVEIPPVKTTATCKKVA